MTLLQVHSRAPLAHTLHRYEELARQLGQAQEAAQLEDEEAELARAAGVPLARLQAAQAAGVPSSAAAAAAVGSDAGFGASKLVPLPY